MSDLITDAMVEAATVASINAAMAPYGAKITTTTDLQGGGEALAEMRAALEVVATLIAAKVLRCADESLARAASQVDTLHHFHGFKCLCGFEGDARARTQTEHITSMLLDTNASVRAERIERGES